MSMGAKGGSNQVVNAGKAALGLPKGSLPEGDTPGSVVKKIVRLPVEEFRRKWDVSVTVHAAHWGKDDATANKSGTDKGTSGKGV